MLKWPSRLHTDGCRGGQRAWIISENSVRRTSARVSCRLAHRGPGQHRSCQASESGAAVSGGDRRRQAGIYALLANCHGLNAEGSPGNDLTPAAPDLTDKECKNGSTDGEIFNSIKNGIGPDFNMGAFTDQLKDEDIWKVVNYVRSLAKK